MSRARLSASLEFLLADFPPTCTYDMLLSRNYRVNLYDMLQFVQQKGHDNSGGKFQRNDPSWIPVCLLWEADYFKDGKCILLCDPSKDFVEGSHRTEADETAGAAYLAYLQSHQGTPEDHDLPPDELQQCDSTLEQQALTIFVFVTGMFRLFLI